MTERHFRYLQPNSHGRQNTGLALGREPVVEMVPRRGDVTLRKWRYDLENPVAGITPDNRRGEADWGAAQSAEGW